MMYDNLSNRLRGEAEVSNASPYIKELMRQAADSLDSLYHAVQALASTTDAPTITNAERIKSAKTEEELMECIFHALKMSRQYIDSRRGMVEWLKGAQWGYPIIPAKEGE